MQDSYDTELKVADARLIIGGLIERTGKVDNDVEGMDVYSITAKSNKVEGITWAERQGIEREPLSFNFKEELDDLKDKSDRWQKLYHETEDESPYYDT